MAEGTSREPRARVIRARSGHFAWACADTSFLEFRVLTGNSPCREPPPGGRLLDSLHMDRHNHPVSGVRPGDVVAGKFQIERVLGEGGMGFVVAARHLQLGQMVALKFMREEVLTPEYRSRFLREARNTVRLKSKHVSRVLDVGSLENGSPYMVMEYLEGTDLSEHLHNQGPVPAADACDYVIQACEAIAEAHSHGIVHRDLKPANLFLTKGTGGEPVIKVLDFGVSKVLELGMDDADGTNPGGRMRRADSVVTKASDLLGSPSYMAPEQVVSARDADNQSDIWSLGVIIFRLISGRAPFNAPAIGELIQSIMQGPIPNLRDVRPDLPPGLEHVVMRCLERDRTRRLGDVKELARLLAPYAGPVATPSLERIAILGPALITVQPQLLSPPPHPRQSSFTPASGSTGPNPAWVTGPVPPPPIQPRQEMSFASAILWGVLFAIVLGCVITAVTLRMKTTTPVTAGPTIVPTITGADPAPQPTVTAVPTPQPPIQPSASASAKPGVQWRGPKRPKKGEDVPDTRN